jgi:hypothetical protein
MSNSVLTTCPVCGEPLEVTRLHCRNCTTTIEGQFETGRLGRLTAEQLEFIEIFIRCEGKFSRMEKELGLSYPTLRGRLGEVIRRLGFVPRPEEPPLEEGERHRILEELATGRISSEEAMHQLEGD